MGNVNERSRAHRSLELAISRRIDSVGIGTGRTRRGPPLELDASRLASAVMPTHVAEMRYAQRVTSAHGLHCDDADFLAPLFARAIRIFRSALFAALLLAIGACGGEDDGGGGPANSGGSGATGGVAGAGGAAGAGAGSAGGAAGSGGAAGAASGGSSSGGAVGSGGAGPDPCPRVKVEVSAGSTLNVRPTPSTAQAPIGALSAGEIVQVLAQVQGEAVNGSTLWFQIATPVLSGYISAEFASCTQEVPPPPPAAY